MYKVKVVIDEERLVKDGKYNLKRYKEAIDHYFTKNGIYKENEYYIGDGRKGQKERLFGSILAIAEKEWFKEYIKEFVYEENLYIEDMLEECKRLKIGAWKNEEVA